MATKRQLTERVIKRSSSRLSGAHFSAEAVWSVCSSDGVSINGLGSFSAGLLNLGVGAGSLRERSGRFSPCFCSIPYQIWLNYSTLHLRMELELKLQRYLHYVKEPVADQRRDVQDTKHLRETSSLDSYHVRGYDDYNGVTTSWGEEAPSIRVGLRLNDCGRPGSPLSGAHSRRPPA